MAIGLGNAVNGIAQHDSSQKSALWMLADPGDPISAVQAAAVLNADNSGVEVSFCDADGWNEDDNGVCHRVRLCW